MRTAEELERDTARIARAVEIEATLSIIVTRHHGRSPEELATWLPGEEGNRLRMLLDEVREWSKVGCVRTKESGG